jgi:DNA-3-methyladenine glycosylase II
MPAIAGLEALPAAERELSTNDPVLADVISSQSSRWPSNPAENPIWGLLRIVMAQQISTALACRLAERATAAFPQITKPCPRALPTLATLRTLGLPRRRAECCLEIIRRSEDILAMVGEGRSWEEALQEIKGIGPWTISVFRIMVIREPDVLALGDVGLERAIQNVYGRPLNVQRLAERWRPFRSVACWYLWRTLGNAQLG